MQYFKELIEKYPIINKRKSKLFICASVCLLGLSFIAYLKIKKMSDKHAKYEQKVLSVPHLTAKLVLNCNNTLGECPIWDDEQQLLCWIDNLSKTFWTYDPKTKAVKSYILPENPGSFCLLESAQPGSYLFAFENGPAFYNVLKDNSIDENKRIFDFEPERRTVMNDGRVDREGRFVVGGMISLKVDLEASGLTFIANMIYNLYLLMFGTQSSVYRINGDLSHEKIFDNISCANSICFTLDGSSMFLTDSYSYMFDPKILRYEYHSDHRLPSTPKKCVLKGGPIPGGEIFTRECFGADGAAIDSNGFLWSAQCGESKVIRYDSNGNMNLVVDVGETHATCCCFGGENMDTLFITTLDAIGMGVAKRKSADQMSGALYAIQLENIQGCKEDRFRCTQ